RVDFQLQREVRPGLREKTEERTSRFATVAFTIVKHATRKFSRFSGIVKIKRGGRYHAVVVIRSGPLVSGVSRTITVRGPAAKKH
ncbi:MAG TPA: hypothetical protein VNZ05_05280, partial [Solirubrobacteraceae bacterium]|nr:hypothetical protein [Solirubrobacteraceae bacterium]